MNWKLAIILTASGILAALLAAAVLVPSWREAVQSYVQQPGFEVLATAEGDLLNDGSLCKVIKYKGSEGIYVEVRKLHTEIPEGERASTGEGDSTLVDRVLLPDKFDGQFNFQGHVTRLAIADIDDDGSLELLAPTFDRDLVPHLNVLRYNATSGRFEFFTPPKGK